MLITNKQLNLLPKRADYIDTLNNNGESTLFLATYLLEDKLSVGKYQKYDYKIVLMGILQNGQRINVILDDIEPYFEVRLKDKSSESNEESSESNGESSESNGETSKEIQTILKLLEDYPERDQITPIRHTIINAKPFKYYQKDNSSFLRLYYRNTKIRSLAIKYLRTLGYETATDDLSCYYRVVCRDANITFSSWATISNFRKEFNDRYKGLSYRVSIKNYKQVESCRNR